MRSCFTNVSGAGTRDEPLRMSAWEANFCLTGQARIGPLPAKLKFR